MKDINGHKDQEMDPFLRQARQYVLSRPNYPVSFVKTILSLCPESKRKTCLDVACGSGQLTLQLADHFEQVVGVDRSEAQLAHALQHDRVVYRRINDATDLSEYKDESFDCLTIAQALHWMPLEPALKEFARVLKPGGVFAALGYGMCSIDGPAQEDMDEYYLRTLGSHFPFRDPRNCWDCDRNRLDSGHANETFSPPFVNVNRMWHYDRKPVTVTELFQYLSTASAYQKIKPANKEDDPLIRLEQRVREKAGFDVDVVFPFWLITASKPSQ